MELIETLKELVKVPTQAGIDEVKPLLRDIQTRLSAEGLESKLLFKGTRPVALLAEIGEGAPIYCLNAPLDTAPIGDLKAWSYPPFAAEIHEGWLYGRGAADAKAGVAIFLKLFIELSKENLKGKLQLLLDADEHTGNFEGARAYLNLGNRPQGLIIGYPGHDKICRGARGVLRIRLKVSGTQQHSGKLETELNAIKRAYRLAELLEMRDFQVDQDFPHPPQVSLVGLRGGEGFTTTPSQAELDLDIRLTPKWNLEAAKEHLKKVIELFDHSSPTPTEIQELLAWPAYQLDPKEPLVTELEKLTGIRSVVSPYSNLGCLFSGYQIPTLCGYGVEKQNLHGPNEACRLDSLDPVYEHYQKLLSGLLKA